MKAGGPRAMNKWICALQGSCFGRWPHLAEGLCFQAEAAVGGHEWLQFGLGFGFLSLAQCIEAGGHVCSGRKCKSL
eukprot:scaffold83564_cov19-Tisochrysis_lutea.AAC.1